jgi:Uma2 family endonuclease
MVVTTPSRYADSSAAGQGYLRAPVPVRFPEGELVPEGRRHFEQRTLLFQVLKLAFEEQAAVGCDQFVYWDPTDPRQCLAPDAFVRLGVPDSQFKVWKVWERGAPEVAVEILSESDERDRDLNAKLEKYRRLGVRELVCFDSEREPASLRVWEAVDGDLVERSVDGHVAPSRCLPATWVVVPDAESGAVLRLSRDAAGRELLPTPAEHERRAAELAREREEEARRSAQLERDRRVAAEARILELEAELRRRGG